MTEISTIYDPSGPEKARRQDDVRLAAALGKPAIESATGISGQSRQEAVRTSAEKGLMALVKHLGVEAVRPTAELLGVNLEE